MTRATVCFESSWIWLQISLIRVHNQRPFDSGSDEGGQRDICVLSGTWFRNMLEWIGAAFTITQLCGNITGIKGCERAETVMEQYAGSTVCQDLMSRRSHKSCVQSLGFIALGSYVWSHQPSPSHSGAEHGPPTLRAVPPPPWGQCTRLRSKLVLGEAAGQQLDGMSSTCTVSLLSAAVTKELPLLALLLLLCLPARCTLLP